MDCGEVGSAMDTMCQRCQRRGTMRERYQCTGCRRLLESQDCDICQPSVAIREGRDDAPGPVVIEERDARLERLRTDDPPPWLVAAVGGGFFGAIAGVVTGLALGESWLIGALIGIIPGVFVGAIFGGGAKGR